MDDESLLAAIGRGDPTAFATLMERHGAFAMTLAIRMTGNIQDAEEVAQEAFLRVWSVAARWNPGGARFTTWLYRVVMNLCLDRKRRAPMAALDDVAEPADTAPDGLERCASDQARELVAEALATLPDRQRAAVSLCYYGEVSCQEAAEALDISLSALESLLVRGRRGLRDYFTRRGLEKMGDVL
ncbi:RNA polymerase sigma factor [Magnetospirillum aberrantis SpK]|uniref:RNA polymerase sigma factor n=2 Tax=Magnetospirillum TaxID=13134 RepID=A0A7C9QTF4_9PROT|nr:RNA polymerase sigma factor [Magnetospirillum aberrantis SpK]